MIHRSVYRVALSVLMVTAMGVAACSPEQKALLPGAAKTPAINAEALNRIIDASFGGQGTCLTLTDRATGREVYVYGSNTTCMRPLPPCSTFKIANSLIGLDEGSKLSGLQRIVENDANPLGDDAASPDAESGSDSDNGA